MKITRKLLEKEIKMMYADCWKYHKEDLKELGITKKTIVEIDQVDLTGWEDVGYFVGYISALQNLLAIKD